MSTTYRITARYVGRNALVIPVAHETTDEEKALKKAEEWEDSLFHSSVEIEEVAQLKLTATAYANSFGEWRARVDFSHSLSESDPRPEFNLHRQWARIRRVARRAIINEIAEREQMTHESLAQARKRISQSTPPLQVIESVQTPMNVFTSFTFGE